LEPRPQIPRVSPAVDEEIDRVEEEGEEDSQEERNVQEKEDGHCPLQEASLLQITAEVIGEAQCSTVRVHFERESMDMC
jgi:hypothetical protein